MVGVFFVLRTRRSRRCEANRCTHSSSNIIKPKPLLFDSPSRWLAIRSNHPQSVQSALGLHHAMPCSWEQGLADAQDCKLFLSPAINGWILALGMGLPEPSDDVDEVFHLIIGLSRLL